MKTKQDTKSKDVNTNKEIRTTVILQEKLLGDIKSIAYWNRTLIKDEVNSALQEAVIKYEKENGPVKPIPKK